MVSKPTSRGLSAGNAACFTCSELTSRELSLGGESFFFYLFQPFLFGSVGLWERDCCIRLRTHLQGSKSGMQSVDKLGL